MSLNIPTKKVFAGRILQVTFPLLVTDRHLAVTIRYYTHTTSSRIFLHICTGMGRERRFI